MLPKIIIDERIKKACPGMRVGLIRAKVTNCETSPELWAEIEREAEAVIAKYELLEINKRPAVAQTRA